MKAEPQLRTGRDWLRYLCCGLCMGAADLVPGISGGTMAFILGIYEALIQNVTKINLNAIALLFRFRGKEFSQTVAWQFLAALLSGMLIALMLLSQFFSSILNDETYRIYLFSGFLGLILGSVIFCAKQIRRWHAKYFVPFMLGAIIAFVFTHFNAMIPSTVDEASFDVEIPIEYPVHLAIVNYDRDSKMLLGVDQKTLAAMCAKGVIDPNTKVYSNKTGETGQARSFVTHAHSPLINWWIIVCGAIGISAMLLPGISGSYLLTILGVYPLIIGALADFVWGLQHFTIDTDALQLLGNLLLGILVGAALFSRVIDWLFLHYHDMTIAMLVGFMLGALRAVWPFWSYQYALIPLKLSKGPMLETVDPLLPSFASEATWLAIAIGITGFALVMAVELRNCKLSHEA